MSRKSQDPENIKVHGKQLVCPVCGNDQFRTRKILLNTRAATTFNIEWANPEPIVISAVAASICTGSVDKRPVSNTK